jgi:hypothetical protein
VNNTLAVSEKLNGVRGEIEQEEAEFEALSKKSEQLQFPCRCTLQQRPICLGLHWRPLFELKTGLDTGTRSFGRVRHLYVCARFLSTNDSSVVGNSSCGSRAGLQSPPLRGKTGKTAIRGQDYGACNRLGGWQRLFRTEDGQFAKYPKEGPAFARARR